jgi:type II secretion system protein J
MRVNPKSEIPGTLTPRGISCRNPKGSQSLKSDRIERTRLEMSPLRSIRFSGFESPSNFEFRISNFPSGFTLIELILAVGVMAVLVIAMNSVFFSAVRLRENTHRAVDEALPIERALTVVRRDLQGLVPPGGMLSGDFKVGGVTSLGLSLPVDIELHTTTGALLENEPWGEVQKVTYALRLPDDRSLPGRNLIRSVTRNLLSSVVPEPEDQWMLGGVESLEFYCFDGSQWRNYWDTSVTDTNLPSAVRVRLQLSKNNGGLAEPAIEIVVPIAAQSRTNQTSTTTGRS